MTGTVVLVVIFFILNIALGSVYIPVKEFFRIIFGFGSGNPAWSNIVMNTRLPQAVTALLAGAALGAGGLMMQTLFRNPLAGPSVLGVSSGASLGVAVMILFVSVPVGNINMFSQFTGSFSIVLAAIAGAILVLVLIGVLAGRFKNNTVVLVMGIMIAYAVSAIVGVLQFYSLKEDLQTFVIWGLGSFANVSRGQLQYFAIAIVAGLLLTLLVSKPLNAMLLGDNYARNLGVNTKKIRIVIILITGLLTAIVTAYCGPIAFLGLAVPHLSRNFFKTSDHLINIPGVIFIGGLLALVCNLIARLPGYDGALPINAITSIMGAPVVIWIIIKRTDFRAEV
jgi:iron complex transport system permease protein